MQPIQIEHTPFARAGSFMTFSMLPPAWGHEGLLLRTMHRKQFHETFRIHLFRDGEKTPYRVEATATLATLTPEDGRGGSVEICLPETDVARIRVSGGLALTLSSIIEGKGIYAFPLGDGVVNVNSSGNGIQYRIFPRRGELDMDMPVHIGDHVRSQKKDAPKPKPKPNLPVEARFTPDAGGNIEFTLQEYVMTPPPVATLDRSFEDCLAEADAHWQAWLATTPEVADAYQEAAELASHVNYASTVGAWGFLKNPTTLMSRNWMTRCWSWDHCFNAIAYAPRNPDTAWDQLNVHFHLQEPGGCLPDGVKAEVCGWNFCKPPIHGWALGLMEQAHPGLLSEERLRDFYPKLCRWTEWWFEARDADGDGLPEYRHGNDSGWDNSTAFDVGFPNCAPDLQGHLVTQMDQLAHMADRLGLDAEANAWRERRDRHVERTIEGLWDEDAGQFRAFQAFSGKREETGNSLLNHMIIVMGEHLPRPYRDKVAEFLRPDGPFVTEYGPATEAPESPKYLYSGYWRGAIWPSSSVLLIDGLWRGGYVDQAREISRRYCEMAKKTLTFAENYDPLSGDPLCDKAYTWGSSGFLILANWLKSRG